MPIIFKKQMTPINEITEAEFNQFIHHHRKHEYTQAEAVELLNLVRKYINKNQASCLSCGNTLREAKTAANEFYLANKDKIIAILDARNKAQEEKPAPVENNTTKKNSKK